MVFLSSWNFAANLAAPFFAVYMLRTLGYSMTIVIVLTTASQLSNLAALGLWGNLIDRFSNKAVLEISAPLFLACTLGWTFTGLAWVGPATLYLLLAIHVLMGIATAGVALASGNIVMKLSPAGQATAFLATSSVVSATCAAMAAVIGGLCADFFAAHQLTLAFTWQGSVDPVTVQVLELPLLDLLLRPRVRGRPVFPASSLVRARNQRHNRSAAGARSAAGSAPVDPKPVECRWSASRGPRAVFGPAAALEETADQQRALTISHASACAASDDVTHPAQPAPCGLPMSDPDSCRRHKWPRLRHHKPHCHHRADPGQCQRNERRLRPQVAGDRACHRVAHRRRHPDREPQYPHPQIEPPAASGDVGRHQRGHHAKHRTAQTVQRLDRNDPQSDRSPPPAAPPAPATRRTPPAAHLAAPIAAPPAPPAATAAPPETAAPGYRRR